MYGFSISSRWLPESTSPVRKASTAPNTSALWPRRLATLANRNLSAEIAPSTPRAAFFCFAQRAGETCSKYAENDANMSMSPQSYAFSRPVKKRAAKKSRQLITIADYFRIFVPRTSYLIIIMLDICVKLRPTQQRTGRRAGESPVCPSFVQHRGDVRSDLPFFYHLHFPYDYANINGQRATGSPPPGGAAILPIRGTFRL